MGNQFGINHSTLETKVFLKVFFIFWAWVKEKEDEEEEVAWWVRSLLVVSSPDQTYRPNIFQRALHTYLQYIPIYISQYIPTRPSYIPTASHVCTVPTKCVQYQKVTSQNIGTLNSFIPTHKQRERDQTALLYDNIIQNSFKFNSQFVCSWALTIRLNSKWRWLKILWSEKIVAPIEIQFLQFLSLLTHQRF